jgi:hypothetical protein
MLRAQLSRRPSTSSVMSAHEGDLTDRPDLPSGSRSATDTGQPKLIQHTADTVQSHGNLGAGKFGTREKVTTRLTDVLVRRRRLPCVREEDEEKGRIT